MFNPDKGRNFKTSEAEPNSHLLTDDVKMAQLIKTHDWAKSPLGPIEHWPASLITTVNIMLESRFPMVIYWGPELITLYNDGYAPIFGSRHPHALGKPFIEVWGEAWDTIQPMFEKVMQGESTWSENQLLLLTRNGYLEECYFTWSFSPIRNEAGQVAGIVTPITETTQRILGEKRLQLSKELGSQTVNVTSFEEACSLSMEVLSEHQSIVPFAFFYLLDEENNKLILKDTTWQKGEEVGIPYEIDLTRDSPLMDYFQVAKENQGQVKIESPELTFGRLPRAPWPEPSNMAIATAIRESSEANAVLGLFVIGTNPRRAYDQDYENFIELISEQITKAITMGRAYEHEQERIDELAQLNKAKTVFFNNISHEFRTPLALMLGPLADSLADKEDPLSEPQRERQIMVQRNALRLLKLVNSLLDFSRIEAGRAQAIYTPIDLAKLTKELASLFESLLTKAGIEFHVEVENLSQPVYVDTFMWEKIVLNLLSNAFKFTMHGSISVSLKQDENHVMLKVSDTGSGIPNEALSHLFERFYRVESAQGRSFEGSGIGLALAKELAQLHGGNITVESKEGNGSCFSVSIPLGKSHLPSEHIKETPIDAPISLGESYLQEAWQWLQEGSYFVEASPKSNPRSDSGENELDEYKKEGNLPKGKILIVDDSADVRTYIKNILSKHWEVGTATNGEEAYQMITQNVPDLILTDAMMPIVDGFGLIARLRENPVTKHLPIIMLSARAGEESKVEGLKKGADDYLIKTSFSAKELLARVKVHLELGNLRSQLERKIQKRTEELKKLNEKLQEEIRERKLTEQTLAESKKRTEFLMSVAPVGIFQCDANGQFIYVNQQACSIFGIELEDFKQNRWIEAIHPEDRADIANEWFSFLSKKSGSIQLTYRVVSSTDEIRWIYSQAEAEMDGDNIVGYTATTTDITLIKKLELEKLQALSDAEKIQRQKAQSEEASKKRKSEFIDTLCHEIRNPLNGIVGSVELLMGKLETMKINANANESVSQLRDLQELEDMISSISECAEHQTTIVNEVLNLSKLESSKDIVSFASFSPRKMIDAVINMYKAEITRKSLNIISTVDEKMIVKSDADKIKDILVNFISNAIKFTPSKGHIIIRLSVSDIEPSPLQVKFSLSEDDPIKLNLCEKEELASKVTLHFSIEDTGIGVSKRELSKIFKPFHQAGEHISKIYGGTGLGLSISQRLVKLLGGEIYVISEEGRGSTFSFTATGEKPGVDETLSSPKKQERYAFFARKPEHQKERTILIVDDSELNQKILAKFLSKKGYKYLIASDGIEAVEYFEPGKFDLIFMDLIMPNLSGFEASKKIREKEKAMKVAKSVPIIALSGNAREENYEEVMRNGMNDFVTKPITSAQVYALIDKWAKSDSEQSRALL